MKMMNKPNLVKLESCKTRQKDKTTIRLYILSLVIIIIYGVCLWIEQI